MADKTVRYAPEFRRQMVELVRTGRSPASLAKEFGPSGWTISLWVKQAARDGGKGDGGLTSPEREETDPAAARESQAQGGARHPLKSRGLVRHRGQRELEALFGFVKVNQAGHKIGVMCQVLGISRSGYYGLNGRCARASARISG